MLKFRIDDTGDDGIFNSQNELAEFLGCAHSNITWCRTYKSDKKNHFWCCEYGITILERKRPDYHKSEQCKQKQRKYYQEHREKILNQSKEWRKNNPDKFKEQKEKWRKAHQEWYNAYYREQRRQKREKQND